MRIITLDPEGRVRAANPSALALFDCRHDAIVDGTLGALLPGHGSGVEALGGSPGPAVIPGRRPDGTGMLLEVAVAPWSVGDRVFHTVILRERATAPRDG